MEDMSHRMMAQQGEKPIANESRVNVVRDATFRSSVGLLHGVVVVMAVLLLAVTASLRVAADDRSDALLAALSGKIESLGDYEVAFRVVVKEQGSVSGVYVVSGDKYYIRVEDREVFCDGKTRCEVSHADKEVTIDRVDPNDRNILSNPTKAFEFADDQFRHTYVGEQVGEGRRCDAIALEPTFSGASFSDVLLLVDRATGLPMLLQYKMDGSSDEVSVIVERFGPTAAKVDPSRFSLNRSKYKGYEFIDFR